VYDKNIINPYQRLMASPDFCDEVKIELTGRMKQYDSVKLQSEGHKTVDALQSLNKAINLESGKALRQQVGVVFTLHAV
jgi:hypothetical protein